jgi:non-specific serine/threonine protein kinase/serine/threonine-protein kinase
MDKESSAFGADPEQIDKLLAWPLDDNTEEIPTASLNQFAEGPGSYVGHYKVMRVLGEGGMGIVYLAEQEKPIKRRVALKVIKPGMDSKQVIARFEAERQALALLDHPNIAHVYDAGTTESGRPYFVMEYVKGSPITEHCDEQKLNIEERLRLFQQICDAVQHAHHKGIIHRDLKPSNIMVTLHDGKPVPKVIDFGVAKAITQSLTERTLVTEHGQLFGTPEYMSPEQADMTNEDIDIRSDIYSLGVLLYVLLTGALPFDSDTFRQGGIEDIRKVIRETNPKTPSTHLSHLGNEAEKVAQRRRTAVATLVRCLHKELEWIPLKAMCKERTERYRSASELADDIEKYLKGEPLIAGPPGIGYKLKKFVRRNRVLVIGIGAVLAILVVGVAISTIFAIRAKRALHREARAHVEAQAVSDFLRLSVLESLDPYRVGGRQITIRTILDTASKDLQNEFHGTPMAEAEIRRTIGFAYWSLGFYEQHELHYRRAIDICRAELGNGDPKTLLWVKELGWGYFARSQFKEAEKLFSEAFKGMQRELGEKDPNTLHAMASLGIVYYMQGRFQEAERLCRNALETNRFVRGEELEGIYCFMLAKGYHFQGFYEKAEQLFTRAIDNLHGRRSEKDWYTLTARLEYGELCRDLGRYEEAEHHLLEVLNDWRDAWGREHPETLWTKTYLGWLYLSQGRYKEAEELLYTTLETARQALGEVHVLSAHSIHGLGTLYLSQERYDEAEQFLTDASDILCHILGEENWTTLDAISTLAKLYVAQRRYTEAEDMYLKTLEAQDRVLGEKHLHTLRSMNGLAQLYTQQAQYQKAESLFTKVLEIGRSVVGATHPQILASMHNLAMLYEVQGLYDKAEPVLLQALEGRRLKLGDTHPHTLESLNNLIDLYKAWNKPKKAEEWRTKLPQTEITEE